MFWEITKLRLSLSLPQGSLRGKPKTLLVGGHVDCKGVDSSIMASKRIWEELNERACAVDALGPRGGALCNNCLSGYSECVDVHRRRILVPPRRTCSRPGCECTIEDLLSKLICVSRQTESAMEAMGNDST